VCQPPTKMNTVNSLGLRYITMYSI